MVRHQNIRTYILMMLVAIFILKLTIPFAQTNDVPEPEKINTKESAKIVDSATENEIQDRFNELRKELLDTRKTSLDRWMWFIGVLLAFFGFILPIAIAIISQILVRHRVREFESEAKKYVEEAKKYVEEIKEHHAESKKLLSDMTSEETDDTDNLPTVEKAIENIHANPEPSLIDKVIVEINTLRHDGKIEEAIEKWRSIANLAEGNDNELAARAWLSIRYFHTKEEDRLAAYNQAMKLAPDYTRAYIERQKTKYLPRSPHGVVVNKVLHYFEDPMYDKLSTAQEYRLSSDPYRADVVLQDEEGQLVVIVECKVHDYIHENTLAMLKRFFVVSNAPFGLLAAGTDISKWFFYKTSDGEMIEISRSEFETGVEKFRST